MNGKYTRLNIWLLGNLQGPDTSSQLPNLAPQTLRIAEEIDKHSSLERNLLCMMFHNLRAKVQKDFQLTRQTWFTILGVCQ